MSRRQQGYDTAKQQHEAGLDIALVLQGFRQMPASAYANGGLEYVSSVLATQAPASKLEPVS